MKICGLFFITAKLILLLNCNGRNFTLSSNGREVCQLGPFTFSVHLMHIMNIRGHP